MAQDCCETGSKIMILACSGASYAGQLSNRAAVELNLEGFGKIACLAGIGAQLRDFVQRAKNAPVIAAVDGCSVGCAKAILKNVDIGNYNYIVLTDLGVEKNKNSSLTEQDVRRVKNAVRAACAGQQPAVKIKAAPAKGGCCG
jgi:uncharacterized metal-binding protein